MPEWCSVSPRLSLNGAQSAQGLACCPFPNSMSSPSPGLCGLRQTLMEVFRLHKSILENRDITFPTKVRLVKAMVFPVVMYGCESRTVKKASGSDGIPVELF